MKNVTITEKQADFLLENAKIKLKSNRPIDSDKVKHIVKYLDKTFKRGTMNGIGDDGFPSALPIVAMLGSDGSVLRNMTDIQLFYLLQDRFCNLYDDKDIRDRFLKQVIKDWYPRKITKDGLLTVNMI